MTTEDNIRRALGKDDVLRATDDGEIDIRVINGVVHMRGYIASNGNRQRVEEALRDIDGIRGSRINLVTDDELKYEVAALLGELEQTYHFRIFTGVSHGVVILNGDVISVEVRKKAEQYAASHPNVRGVINYLRVRGVALGIQDQRFLQPPIGAEIHFRDGTPGTVQKVVISQDNRRVVAMVTKVNSVDQLLVIPIGVMGYFMKDSGFLTIASTDQAQYQGFDPSLYAAPNGSWVPPYPYCADDVLFPVDYQKNGEITGYLTDRSAFLLKMEDRDLEEQLLANDSLGG